MRSSVFGVWIIGFWKSYQWCNVWKISHIHWYCIIGRGWRTESIVECLVETYIGKQQVVLSYFQLFILFQIGHCSFRHYWLVSKYHNQLIFVCFDASSLLFIWRNRNIVLIYIYIILYYLKLDMNEFRQNTFTVEGLDDYTMLCMRRFAPERLVVDLFHSREEWQLARIVA